MKTITVTELTRRMTDFINHVFYKHESYLILRGNKPVAEIRPVPALLKAEDLPRVFQSMPRLSAEDLAALERDMAEIRDVAAADRGINRWDS